MRPVKDDTAQTSQKDHAAHSSCVGQALWLLELRSHGRGCTSAWSFTSCQTKLPCSWKPRPMSLQYCSFSALMAANTCDLGGNDALVREREHILCHDSSLAFPNALPQKHCCSPEKIQAKKYLCLLDRHPSPQNQPNKKNQNLL